MVKPGKSDLNGFELLQGDKPREWFPVIQEPFEWLGPKPFYLDFQGKKIAVNFRGPLNVLIFSYFCSAQLLSDRKTRVVTRSYNMMGLCFDFTSTAPQYIQESIYNKLFPLLKRVKDFIQLTLVTREEKQWHSLCFCLYIFLPAIHIRAVCLTSLAS